MCGGDAPMARGIWLGGSDSFWYSHDCDLMDRTAWCLAVFPVYFMSFGHTSTQWLKYLGSNFRCTCGGLAFILAVLYLLVMAVAARILGTTVCWRVVTLAKKKWSVLFGRRALCASVAGVARLLEPLPFQAKTETLCDVSVRRDHHCQVVE